MENTTRFIEFNGYAVSPVFVTIEFDHPEYGCRIYDAIGLLADDMPYTEVAQYFWEKYNHYGVMFDMKITYKFPCLDKVVEKVIYEGGNPNCL